MIAKLHRGKIAFCYKFGNVIYGKNINSRLYCIGLVLPIIDKEFYLYKERQKPIFFSMFIYGVVWFPISYLALAFVVFCVFVYLLLGSFYTKSLSAGGYLDSHIEFISGYLMLCLSILGLVQIFNWIFN